MGCVDVLYHTETETGTVECVSARYVCTGLTVCARAYAHFKCSIAFSVRPGIHTLMLSLPPLRRVVLGTSCAHSLYTRSHSTHMHALTHLAAPRFPRAHRKRGDILTHERVQVEMGISNPLPLPRVRSLMVHTRKSVYTYTNDVYASYACAA